MTESDFPNIFDDLAMFDEMDKQKLSKKQKKKLKKKKSNKKKPQEESSKTSENEIILMSEEKKSVSAQEIFEEKPKQMQETPHEIPKEEEMISENEQKPNEILETPNEIIDKPEEIVEETKEIVDKSPELDIKAKEFINEVIEKPKELENSQRNSGVKDEFIEVTKRNTKPIIKENNKRFSQLSSKPVVVSNKFQSKSSYNSEDRFKFEKDSRKKSSDSNNFSKPTYFVKGKAINLINTTELEAIEDKKNEKNKFIPKENEEKEKEVVMKSEHGITLCKKKHAKDVLLAKIKRKEIERKQVVPKNSESQQNYGNPEKFEVINEKPIEKKEIYMKEINDPILKKEYKGLSHKIFWRKMDNDLNKFTENIANECKRMKVYRICVFDRIEFIVSNLFANFNAHIKMYGSCVTGSLLINIYLL